MKKLCISVALAAAVLAPTGASASPPAGSVPAHDHWVVTGTGEPVQVGPDSCEDGQSHQFDQFHRHVHAGQPGDRGIVVRTLCE